ncbi:MAG: hypothetical protein Q4C90_09880 [Kocuria sp.]|uniref:hypothetical protein n=1 Tax=Kocuria TaxID=57493 RepID=UPI001FD41AB6|nr:MULTISPECIES: hypothetical protein [Kocuria]MDO4257448.1 hypothetical protein [Kocuria sp.]
MAVGAFISGASARHLAARFAAPGTVLIGLGLEVVGVVVLALLMGPSTSAWLVALPLVGYGVGLCLASAQPTGTVLRDVTVASSGQASATQSTVRQIGSALGTAFAGAALSVSMGLTLPSALTATGSTHATQWALVIATGFILLGFHGALQVRRAARRDSPEAPAAGDSESRSLLPAHGVAGGRGMAGVLLFLLGAYRVHHSHGSGPRVRVVLRDLHRRVRHVQRDHPVLEPQGSLTNAGEHGADTAC